MTRRAFINQHPTACDGKKRYGESAARKIAKLRSGASGDDLTAYPCHYCRHFHIGHRAFAGRGR